MKDQSPIISVATLNTLLTGEQATHVKLLDATFVLPTSDIDPEKQFLAKRIGQAQFFDIKATANPDTNIPNMLPTPPDFQRIAVRLGICPEDMIVVYGQDGMVMGPARVWWMFRVFGHENVMVLDGGLPAWESAGFPVNTDPPSEFGSRGTFSARFNPDMLKTKSQVESACDTPDIKILDARSPERFNGETPEPRPGMTSGHIPGSHNIPAKSLIDPATGCLKSKEELKTICESTGLCDADSVITTCGSGITACMIALVLDHLGHKNVAVYDGSWSEWGREST